MIGDSRAAAAAVNGGEEEMFVPDLNEFDPEVWCYGRRQPLAVDRAMNNKEDVGKRSRISP